ncbi:hypothetical protein ACVILK_007036 [Bradyrhizobium embrapense]
MYSIVAVDRANLGFARPSFTASSQSAMISCEARTRRRIEFIYIECRPGSAVTGYRLRERLAAPVAEIRDVQTPSSGVRRRGGRVPWVPLWGTAGRGVVGHAEKRRDRPSIQRHQGSHCHRTRIHRPELAYVPLGAVIPWSRPQGRARDHRCLCRPLCTSRRKAARQRNSRRCAGHPVAEALHGVQHRSVRWLTF